jgi:hypothetical protein
MQFSDNEQVSLDNQIISPSGAHEGNWGVFIVSNVATATGDPLTTAPDSPADWVDGTGGAQITGIFYGTTNLSSCPTGVPICAGTGGHLDLYWDTATAASLTQPLTDRTADNQFTNFTDGTFLARLVFDSGIASGDSTVGIVGSTIPVAATSFAGLAQSYMSVDTSVVGAWTALLDGNGYSTAFGARDVYLRNTYTGPLAAWDGGSGTDIVGAQSSDPFRNISSVPEPATLLLMGAGALGLGFGTRRRRQA